MDNQSAERSIYAVKQYAKQQSGLGLIKPIAEVIDGELVALNATNFCATNSVFITSKYEEIDARFRAGEIFRIPVVLNHQVSEKAANPSKYVSQGNRAEKVVQSELAEILDADLPDRNDRKANLPFLPATPYVFMRGENGECFGPFDWSSEIVEVDGVTSFEISLKFITGGGLGAAGSTKQIYQIANDVITGKARSVEIDGRVRQVAANVVAITNGALYFDYASDKEIIEFVRIIAGDAGSRIVDRQKFQQVASIASKNPKNSNQLAKARLAKFGEIIGDSAELMEVIQGGLDSFLKADAGAKILEEYVQRNRSRYVDQLKKDKEIELDDLLLEKNRDIRALEEREEQMRIELTKLNDEIERQRRAAENSVKADQEAIFAKASAENTKKLSESRKQIEELEQKIAELKTAYGTYESIARAEEKIRDLVANQKFLAGQVADEKKQLAGLRQELDKDEDELRKKLRELKPYVEHINGAFAGEVVDAPPISVSVTPFPQGQEKPAMQRSVIEAIQQSLAASGRVLKGWEVANLLICTQQSFITFLAGLPGVGKTSLARLLTQAQGVERRLHEVSVARGWTSQKDLVGFHNPLSDRFQASSTGLYQFLLAIQNEKREEIETAMSYVLLDEANLSPIEHYWSSFMAMTDGNVERVLRLGQNDLAIPENLRFLATINYDGTTEPLSHRVIDRAPVIVMKTGSISENSIDAMSDQLPLPVSSSCMNQLFGLSFEIPSFALKEETAYDDILDVLGNSSPEHGRPISLSQRKAVAIRQYCGTARSIMRPEGELMALDLAVLQHVLPQVRGHGQKFSKRLAALKEVFDTHGLAQSSEYLAQMLLFGEADLHSYDFFCW